LCGSFSVYNNIHHPSKLAVGADFHCFKDKIEPKWEDPICANGGKWSVTLSKGKSDTFWLNTVCFNVVQMAVSDCSFMLLLILFVHLFFLLVVGNDWRAV
jgi:hypothetical protein